jgi:hypothetical protein
MSGIFEVFDCSDPPTAGTACVSCKTRGHFCPAKGYLDNVAACYACGEDKPCPRSTTVAKMHENIDEFAAKATTESQLEERRCTDCRGKLGEQARGTMCWPCRRWKNAQAEKAAKRCAAARAAKAAKRFA